MSAKSNLDSFDAVYYSQQVPRSAEALTILGLVFDRLIFPGVYLPTSPFDEGALKKEIERITSLKMRMSVDDVQMLNCMAFSLHVKYVREVSRHFHRRPWDDGTRGARSSATDDVVRRTRLWASTSGLHPNTFSRIL